MLPVVVATCHRFKQALLMLGVHWVFPHPLCPLRRQLPGQLRALLPRGFLCQRWAELSNRTLF